MDDKSSSTTNRGHQLVVEPETTKESEDFSKRFTSSVHRTREDLINAAHAFGDPEAFRAASEIVMRFKPVPWFIWRLTNYIFSQGATPSKLPEGFVLGLRRLLFATASDPVFGKNTKVNSLRQALEILDPEVIGAVSAIHAMCRRLMANNHERIWRPILEDALVRTRIGYHIGCAQSEFGGGKGMLAGFVGRVGLAIAIATNDEEHAHETLDLLAQGRDAGMVGEELFGCHPLYIGSMILSSIGCGGNASLGTLAYLATSPQETTSNFEQRLWLSAHAVVQAARQGDLSLADIDDWEIFRLDNREAQEKLLATAREYVRKDHGLNWIV